MVQNILFILWKSFKRVIRLQWRDSVFYSGSARLFELKYSQFCDLEIWRLSSDLSRQATYSMVWTLGWQMMFYKLVIIHEPKVLSDEE